MLPVRYTSSTSYRRRSLVGGVEAPGAGFRPYKPAATFSMPKPAPLAAASTVKVAGAQPTASPDTFKPTVTAVNTDDIGLKRGYGSLGTDLAAQPSTTPKAPPPPPTPPADGSVWSVDTDPIVQQIAATAAKREADAATAAAANRQQLAIDAGLPDLIPGLSADVTQAAKANPMSSIARLKHAFDTSTADLMHQRDLFTSEQAKRQALDTIATNLAKNAANLWYSSDRQNALGQIDQTYKTAGDEAARTYRTGLEQQTRGYQQGTYDLGRQVAGQVAEIAQALATLKDQNAIDYANARGDAIARAIAGGYYPKPGEGTGAGTDGTGTTGGGPSSPPAGPGTDTAPWGTATDGATGTATLPPVTPWTEPARVGGAAVAPAFSWLVPPMTLAHETSLARRLGEPLPAPTPLVAPNSSWLIAPMTAARNRRLLNL